MGTFGKLCETLGNLKMLLWLGEPKGILGNLKRVLWLGEPKEILGNLKRLLWLGEPRGIEGNLKRLFIKGSQLASGEPPGARTIAAPLRKE